MEEVEPRRKTPYDGGGYDEDDDDGSEGESSCRIEPTTKGPTITNEVRQETNLFVMALCDCAVSPSWREPRSEAFAHDSHTTLAECCASEADTTSNHE